PPPPRSHRERLQACGRLPLHLALRIGERDQSFVRQIAVRAPSARAGELGDIRFDAGYRADMRVLHIEEQRPRHAVIAGGDVLEGRLDAADPGTLKLVTVLVEEAEAEDAEGVRVG